MTRSLAAKELASALLIVAIFAFYGVAGLPYGLGSVLEPGPGVVPHVVAVVGFVLGLWMLAEALRKPGDATYEKWTRQEAIRAIGFPASIVLATLMTPLLGHITSLALMAAFVAWLLGVRRWTETLIIAVGAGIIIWVVFVNILDAGLVAGPLGF